MPRPLVYGGLGGSSRCARRVGPTVGLLRTVPLASRVAWRTRWCPLIGLLEENGADEACDDALVREGAGCVGAAPDRALRGSMGFPPWILARCSRGKGV